MEELDKRTKIMIMLAIMASMLFASLNQTIVGTALPRIVAELGGMEYYSWVFTIYMLTSSVTGLLVGKLSDMYGRKPFILVGLLLFMIGAFLTGTSQDIIQMILYRGLQGFGGGFIMSTAFSAIGDLFPPRERGKWQGLMGAVFGMSAVIGPFLGGWIVDNADWKWVFWVNLPIGVIAFLLIMRLFPKKTGNVSGRVDYAGAVFVSGLLVSLLLAFSWGGSKYEWNSMMIIGLFAAAVVALLLFIWAESRAEQPVLPLSLFKNSIFNIANLIGFLTGVAMFGSIMYIPLFVQGVVGTSATASGLVTMPMMIAMVAASALSGQLTSRTGRYKAMALVGGVVLAIGMFMLTRMSTETTNLMASIDMIVVGAGLGFSMPILMLAVQNATPQKLLGVTSSAVQLFRQIGGTVGVAIMGTLMNNKIQEELTTIMPDQVKQFLAAPEMATHAKALTNPQLLVAPAQLEAIRSALPAQVLPIFDQLIEALKTALVGGLDVVFFVGFIIALVALVVTFFLKEIPLRTSNKDPEPNAKPDLNKPDMQPSGS
ncbi:MFS transporter [Tumebacillus algifaecis]|uniref:MFS transporter n=1 Tax=Tumebacillus algifaecis TaxID=1214604 RepID=A0A223CY92_9BACL|nr:MDR family MFS transporter [Tumebacillus algifaecis]ASS74281.1 MFS transporter [Tumebacillus algifaecis]